MYPIQAQIKTQLTFQEQEEEEEYQFNTTPMDKYTKHFGILINTIGDTTQTGDKTLQTAYTRLRQINRKGLNPEVSKALHTALISSVDTYNPLCNQIKIEKKQENSTTTS
jgi:hypothetical protein